MSDQLREAARALCEAIDAAKIPHADGGREVLNAWDALRAALDAPQAEAAPKAGAGDAYVAWRIADRNGRTWKASHERTLLDRECDSLNGEKGRAHYLACGPYYVAPLYAHHAPASPAMAVVAATVAWRQPHHTYAWTHDSRLAEVVDAYLAAQEPPRAKPEGGEGVAK